MPEAPLEDSGSGLAPAGDGWFVVNVRDAQWLTSENGEKRPSGSECAFESRKFEFPQFGIRLHVLEPGEPNGLYHSESQQEAFLVLSGECTLLVEGEERPLGPWDFFHSPAGTEHIFVGAGDGPCVILMAGSRSGDWNVLYPVSELAARYGASAEEETTDPDEAYVGVRAVAAGAALVLGPPPLGLEGARVGDPGASTSTPVRELLAGLWHWQAPHPDWQPSEPWAGTSRPTRSTTASGCCSSTRWPCRARSRARGRAARRRSCSPRRGTSATRESLVERLGVPVYTPLPDTAQDLMDMYGITAEQAATAVPTSSGCSARRKARHAVLVRRPAAVRCRRVPRA